MSVPLRGILKQANGLLTIRTKSTRDSHAAGRMTSDDAMQQLGVDSLDILYQRVLAIGLAVLRTDAMALVKGPVKQELP